MASKLTFATDLSGTKITLGNYYTPAGSYTNIYVSTEPPPTSEQYTTQTPILSLTNMDSDKKPHDVNIQYLNITYQLLKILDPVYTLQTIGNVVAAANTAAAKIRTREEAKEAVIAEAAAKAAAEKATESKAADAKATEATKTAEKAAKAATDAAKKAAEAAAKAAKEAEKAKNDLKYNFILNTDLPKIYNPIVDVSGAISEKFKTKLFEIILNVSNIITYNDYNTIFKYEATTDETTKKPTNIKTQLSDATKEYKKLTFNKDNYEPLLKNYIDFLNNWITILKSDPKDFSSLSANIEKITKQLNTILQSNTKEGTVADVSTPSQ